MPDSITHGQFRRFLKRNRFFATGKKKNKYVGVYNGIRRMVVFHYHKDNDTIPMGTLSSMAKQLEMTKQDLIDIIKERDK